jgi:hypothetical protein
MSLNVVNVTVAADNSPADQAGTYAEGNVVAVPAGTEWPDTSGNAIVPAVVHGFLVNGTCTIELVASDNFGAGVLLWDFIINIRGMPTVNVSDAAVNFSSGANQNVWTILAAAGWTPPPSP